jgi:hypothetical protein
MENGNSGSEFFRQVQAGSWITQGLSVVAELGIPDLLTDGARAAEDLANDTGTDGNALYRLMRALASIGVFAQGADGRFSLTPLAEKLRSEAVASQRAFAIMAGAEFQQTWGELLYSVRTGKHGFENKFGRPWFQYMTEHPDRHSIYDAAMTAIHGGETQPMLDAYDFSSFRTVVDVGGGNGTVLVDILSRHSHLQGILFDLPAVADRAGSVISSYGLSDRCRTAGGDFFASVPPGADGYLMRHVIHDWEDDEATTILRRCQEAMHPDGRVLVVETVIPNGNEPCFGKWLDLMMLLVGGRERTEAEYRRIFAAAGLKLSRVIPTSAEVSVIEGVRA